MMIVNRTDLSSAIVCLSAGSKFKTGLLRFTPIGDFLSLVLYTTDIYGKHLSVSVNDTPYRGVAIDAFTLELSEIKRFLTTSKNSIIQPNKENIEFAYLANITSVALSSNIASILQDFPLPDYVIKRDEVMKDYTYPYDELKIPLPLFASSGKDHFSASINGIFFDFKNGKMVGTDSRSLCVVDIVKCDIDSFILPHTVIIPDAKINNISIGKETISVHYDSVVLTSKVISSKYIDYNSIIPLERTAHIKFNGLDVKAFLSSSDGSLFSATFTYGKMRLETMNTSMKHTVFSMDFDCTYPHKEAFTLNFDKKHMMGSITTNNCAIVINYHNSVFFILDEYETLIAPIDHREGASIAIKAVDADDDSIGFTYKEDESIKSPTKSKSKKADEVFLLREEIKMLKTQLADANNKIAALHTTRHLA